MIINSALGDPEKVPLSVRFLAELRRTDKGAPSVADIIFPKSMTFYLIYKKVFNIHK